MVFYGFDVRQPLVSLVHDGCPPLVKRWSGWLPSLKSKSSDDDDGDDNDVDADAGIHQISAALEFPADLLSIVGLEVPFQKKMEIGRHKLPKRTFNLSCR